jgi:peptidoglycan/LPS O-acetylase OafA/YrhL
MDFSRPLRRIYGLDADSGAHRRVETMEGARGLAVLLVFFVHYRAGFQQWTSGFTRSFSEFMWTVGHGGVDLFFVLSGYLIYAAVMKRDADFASFIRRRLQRIYPPFVAVFLLYVALSFVFPAVSKLPDDASQAAIYLLQNLLLLPGIFPIEPLIAVAWSLSYELFYYLTLPVIALGLGMPRWQRRTRVLFFVALGAAFVASWWLIQPVHPRLLMFIAGILLYEAVQSSPREALSRPVQWSIVALFALTCVAIAAVYRTPDGELYRTLLAFVPFGLLVYGCFRAGEAGPIRGFLGWAPMRALGNMSYSYYLIHALMLRGIMLVTDKLIPPDLAGPPAYWVLLPFIFAATLVPSTILFVAVEKPFSLTRRTRAAAPAAPQLAVS